MQSGPDAVVLTLWRAKTADPTIAINKLMATTFDFVFRVLKIFSFVYCRPAISSRSAALKMKRGANRSAQYENSQDDSRKS